MPPTAHLLAFALISFALIVVPGPNVLFVISRSLMLGRAAGVGSAVGGQIGVYAQVAAVAVGVGALVERSVALFTVIKLAGAAYLVFLACRRCGTAARWVLPCTPRWSARPWARSCGTASWSA
jgi:threonine/homoserine/homoserine lactone efflux protein